MMSGQTAVTMKQVFRTAVLVCWILAGATCLAENDSIKDVSQLELNGQFKEAAALLHSSLQSKSLSAAERKKLEFELDRLDRIKKDFPSTKEDLFAELKKAVKDLNRAEFDKWVAEGRFDSREIDGKRYFMSSSMSNLYF